MATWMVSDELDARLRRRLGDQDVAEYIEKFITDSLDYDDDPLYQAEVDAQIARSVAELERGEGVDARQAMREIAAEFGIHSKR